MLQLCGLRGGGSATLRPCKQPCPLVPAKGWSKVTWPWTHSQKQRLSSCPSPTSSGQKLGCQPTAWHSHHKLKQLPSQRRPCRRKDSWVPATAGTPPDDTPGLAERFCSSINCQRASARENLTATSVSRQQGWYLSVNNK